MKIYTNNKQAALKVVMAKQDKTTAVEVINKERQSRVDKVHEENYLR